MFESLGLQKMCQPQQKHNNYVQYQAEGVERAKQLRKSEIGLKTDQDYLLLLYMIQVINKLNNSQDSLQPQFPLVSPGSKPNGMTLFKSQSFLRADLNNNHNEKNQISRSSIFPEEADIRRFKDMLDEKDRLIRKLQQRIAKLQELNQRLLGDQNIKNVNMQSQGGENIHMMLLKSEISKTKRLEQIIEEITGRVNVILEELSHENSVTQNSQEIKEMILMLEVSKNQSFSQSIEQQLENSLNISNQWTKAMDILEGAFKTYKMKFQTFHTQNKSLAAENEQVKKRLQELQRKVTENEEVRLMLIELKQEKKQKEKMKKLLERSEFQKNELINKINSTTIREDVKAKTKEELLQYSKQLNYRIKDLEVQKACIIKESNKEKQDDLKKYQDFLKKLKVIKEKSIVGKSYG